MTGDVKNNPGVSILALYRCALVEYCLERTLLRTPFGLVSVHILLKTRRCGMVYRIGHYVISEVSSQTITWFYPIRWMKREDGWRRRRAGGNG